MSDMVDKIANRGVVYDINDSRLQTELNKKQDKLTGVAPINVTSSTVSINIDSQLSKESNNPVQNKVIASSLESKVSKTELEENYTKSENLPQSDWTEAESTSKAFILNKPTKLSEFSNDTNFITNSVNNLTNYYTKSNTYTKNEVNTLIGNLTKIEIQKVDTLPATGKSNVIYLVRNSKETGSDLYNEYIYISEDQKFEFIGTTSVDLSNYYTKTEIDNKLSGKENTITTLPVNKGGTGATTNKGAVYNLLSGINEAENIANDDTPIICGYAEPSTTNGSIYKRKASFFKQYLQNNLSEATTESKGFMSSADKSRLDNINLSLYQLKIEEITQANYDKLTDEQKSEKLFIITDATASNYTRLINDNAKTVDTTWSSSKIDTYLKNTLTDYSLTTHTHASLKKGDYTASLPILSKNSIIALTDNLNNYVQKDGNKVLSTNDFTTTLKTKLENINLSLYSLIGHTHVKNDIEDFPTDLGDFTNNAGYTKNTGTITGIKMNGSSKGSSGIVDLGTVLTSHQNLKTINNNTITGTGNITVGTYSKPTGGIPKSDLSSSVQSSLGKADTALQEHQDLSNYVQKDGNKVLSDYNFSEIYKTRLDNLSGNYVPSSRKVNGLTLDNDINIITTSTQAQYNELTSDQKKGKLFVITDSTSGDYVKLINDEAKSTDTTWSSNKITNELNKKQNVLQAGSGIHIDGDTISADSVSQATNTTLGTIKLGSNTVQTIVANSPTRTSGRTYPVQVNSSGQAVVNVPWINTQTDPQTYELSIDENNLSLTDKTAGTSDIIDFVGKYGTTNNNMPYFSLGLLKKITESGKYYHYVILGRLSDNFNVSGNLLMARDTTTDSGVSVNFDVINTSSKGDYSLNYRTNSKGYAKLIKITISSVTYIAIELYTGATYNNVNIYWNIIKSGAIPNNFGVIYSYATKQTSTELTYSKTYYRGEIDGIISKANNDKNGNDIVNTYHLKTVKCTQAQYNDLTTEERKGKFFIITDSTASDYAYDYTRIINDNASNTKDTTWSNYKINYEITNRLSNYVPTTRTINNKSLNANISLTTTDIGAADKIHTHTKSQITDFPTLSTVATSGNYTDLNNIPTTFTPSTHNHKKEDIEDFPENLSDFEGYTQLTQDIENKQDKLISGTNIKKINNTSLLGSGNITVGTYSKPTGGIPKSDLSSSVQSSLGKADTALQEHQDLSNYVQNSRTVNGFELSSDVELVKKCTESFYHDLTTEERKGKFFIITDSTASDYAYDYTRIINDNASNTKDTTWSNYKLGNEFAKYQLKGNYVLQETGKGLSTNDFTTTYKNKLDGIETGAQKNTITGVKGDSETSYRTGDVNITKANIGLGNVGNFKAVSTVASQGLTATEKTNARSNIGAGTSSFSGSYNDLSNKPTLLTIGTTSTTAAAGNHNHDTVYVKKDGDKVLSTNDFTTTYKNTIDSLSDNYAAKDHNHDTTYLKLSGGTVTGNTIFSGGIVIPVGRPSTIQNGSMWIEN